MSHLRFGPQQITSEYLIDSNADFITCTKEPFIRKYGAHMIKALKDKGSFLLNTPDDNLEQLEAHMPPDLMRALAEKEVSFYTIDASKVAKDVGMAKRTNTVMQVAFFVLALKNVMPADKARELLVNDITTRFKLKGDKIIQKNLEMVDKAEGSLKLVPVPAHWRTIADRPVKDMNKPLFVTEIMDPVLKL